MSGWKTDKVTGTAFERNIAEMIQETILTVSLAGLTDPGEVLVAAALVGAFGVVADVGTNSKLQTFILI